eukprot:14912521-Heterocapsa_arctica.AAC.1
MKKLPKVGLSSAKAEPSAGPIGAPSNLQKVGASSTSGSGRVPRPSCSPDVTRPGKARGLRNLRTLRRVWRPGRLPLRKPGGGCGTLVELGGPRVTPTVLSTTSRIGRESCAIWGPSRS